ncbi:MAG TPA: hypothetical protein VHM90_12430 [Phycisphaerae bacterium]|nr:hypothetical protein [Phycisphaerae bacterium]
MNKNGTSNGEQDVRKLLDEGAVLNAAKRGVQRELKIHKALGNPVAAFREGKIVLIPPDEIQIDEPGHPGSGGD